MTVKEREMQTNQMHAKRKIQKAVFFLLILIVGGLSLTSCARKPEGESGKVVIRFAQWGSLEELEATKEMVKEFESQYQDIRVRVEHMPDYWTRLQTQVAGGVPPDVWIMSGSHFYSFTKKGVVKNLQPYIERDKVDLKAYYEMPLNLFTYQGSVYGLPRDFNIIALV